MIQQKIGDDTKPIPYLKLFFTHRLRTVRWELQNFSICMALSSHTCVMTSSTIESGNASRWPGMSSLCSTKLRIVFRWGDLLTSSFMQSFWYCPFEQGPWSSLRACDLYIDDCDPTSVSPSNVEQSRKEHFDGVRGQHSISYLRRLGNHHSTLTVMISRGILIALVGVM